jgi:myo-inositol-1(or 4)-monophosphatase
MSISYDHDIALDALIVVAADAARQAGAILTECTRTGFRIEHKQIINLVTDADHQAEQRIIDVIHGAFPTHRVLADRAPSIPLHLGDRST